MSVATPGPDTAYGKELAKHEQRPSRFTNDDVPPGRPYRYEEYPRMVYKAVEHPKTKQMVCMPVQPNPLQFSTPHEYDAAMRQTEELNRHCYRIVKDDAEFRNAKNEGWHESPAVALTGHDDAMWKIAEATAERNFRDQNMSPAAKAEAAAIDNSTEHQVPDVQVEKSRRAAREQR